MSVLHVSLGMPGTGEVIEALTSSHALTSLWMTGIYTGLFVVV